LFCSKCGTQVNQNDTHCHRCGNALRRESQYIPNNMGSQKQKNHALLISVIIGVCLLLIIAMIVFFGSVLKPNLSGNNQMTQETPSYEINSDFEKVSQGKVSVLGATASVSDLSVWTSKLGIQNPNVVHCGGQELFVVIPKYQDSTVTIYEQKLDSSGAVVKGKIIEQTTGTVFVYSSSQDAYANFGATIFYDNQSTDFSFLTSSSQKKRMVGLPGDILDVSGLFDEIPQPIPTPTASSGYTGLYYVQKFAGDKASQLGAFAVLSNAINLADKNAAYGYEVYDVYGNCIYAPSTTSSTSSSGYTGLYYVQKFAGDKSSQLGAFAILSNAINLADKNAADGYEVYDDYGNCIYTPSTTSSTSSSEYTGLYYVQKFAGDKSSQLGAFAVYSNAVNLANQHKADGYEVYDENGNCVYTP